MHARSSWLSSIVTLPREERAKIVASLSLAEIDALVHDWRGWARPEQLAPVGTWTRWLILAGRGWGKTRTGAEWIRERIDAGEAKRIALVGRTAADVRDVMIEGESGLLSVFPSHQRPIYEPSKRRVTFHTGAVATTFTSEKPDQLRGPQHDTAWCDEIAAWRYPDAWKQLTMGLRLGRPRVVLTTTPRPTPLVRELIAHKRTHITRGHTKDNAANLAEEFLEEVIAAEGSRFGRQEFGAELLEEIEGALWTLAQIEARVVRPEFRVIGDGEDADYEPILPTFVRTVVSVDPAAKATPKKPRPGETGIVAVGLDEHGVGWVLDDASGVYKPAEWAAKTVELFDRWNADRVVAEDNQGGDMVESTLRAARVSLPIKRVTAITGKAVRAEPVAAFYEPQAGYPLGRVRHLGHHAELETQMATWVPTGDAPSPDRLDALVHGLTELLGREKKKQTKGWSQPVFDRDD